jgi:DNA-binding transcriptional ArsR family regulator
MSVPATNWAWLLDLPPEPKFTMVALADRADEEGICWPSVRWLVKKTGFSERTVRGHLAKFREDRLLETVKRSREDGGQSSNEYRLALKQPGLLLESARRTPGAANAGGAAAVAPTPAATAGGPTQQMQGAPAADAPHDLEVDSSVEVKKGPGRAAPTPVAACFKAYREGIKGRYGADYPPSRRANGMLSHVVDRLGAAPALKVVGFYLAHGKPYYSQRKHALEILVQDCTELWLELQAAAGAGATATTASAFFELGDGRMKLMNEYPVAEPLDVAKACAREYASRIEPWSVRNIVVRIGGRQSKFTPQEVR